MSKKEIWFFVVIALVIAGVYIGQSRYKATPPTVNSTSSTAVLGEHTKSDGCQAHDGLPDQACTPGAVFPAVTAAQICINGYAKTVRNVSDATKKQVFAEYGITSHPSGSYEVDHLISLELGGTNDIANLWPEAASPAPGFHEKDKVEDYLHSQICHGSRSLSEVQQQVANNWEIIYQGLH